jgi:hypothetical protein
MNVNEAARKWGVTPQRVRQLLVEGRVAGAVRPDAWSIPDDAPVPERKKRGPKACNKQSNERVDHESR